MRYRATAQGYRELIKEVDGEPESGPGHIDYRTGLTCEMRRALGVSTANKKLNKIETALIFTSSDVGGRVE